VGLAARERLAFRREKFALHFVQAAGTKLQPEQTSWIDWAGQNDLASWHDRKSNRAEVTLGAGQ
jgi:hypothetical protein